MTKKHISTVIGLAILALVVVGFLFAIRFGAQASMMNTSTMPKVQPKTSLKPTPKTTTKPSAKPSAMPSSKPSSTLCSDLKTEIAYLKDSITNLEYILQTHKQYLAEAKADADKQFRTEQIAITEAKIADQKARLTKFELDYASACGVSLD